MSSRAAVHHPKISSRPLPDAELVAWPIAFTRVRAVSGGRRVQYALALSESLTARNVPKNTLEFLSVLVVNRPMSLQIRSKENGGEH